MYCRAGWGWAGQGRAGQGRAGQGRAGLRRAGSDLESVDGVWIADIVLQEAGLVSWDASRIRHKLDAPPP